MAGQGRDKSHSSHKKKRRRLVADEESASVFPSLINFQLPILTAEVESIIRDQQEKFSRAEDSKKVVKLLSELSGSFETTRNTYCEVTGWVSRAQSGSYHWSSRRPGEISLSCKISSKLGNKDSQLKYQFMKAGKKYQIIFEDRHIDDAVFFEEMPRVDFHPGAASYKKGDKVARYDSNGCFLGTGLVSKVHFNDGVPYYSVILDGETVSVDAEAPLLRPVPPAREKGQPLSCDVCQVSFPLESHLVAHAPACAKGATGSRSKSPQPGTFAQLHLSLASLPIFQEETGILLPSSGKIESVFGGSEASACGFEILKSLQVSFYFAPGMNQKLRQRLHQFTDLILRRKIVSMPQNHKMQDGVMVETIVVPVGTAFLRHVPGVGYRKFVVCGQESKGNGRSINDQEEAIPTHYSVKVFDQSNVGGSIISAGEFRGQTNSKKTNARDEHLVVAAEDLLADMGFVLTTNATATNIHY